MMKLHSFHQADLIKNTSKNKNKKCISIKNANINTL